MGGLTRFAHYFSPAGQRHSAVTTEFLFAPSGREDNMKKVIFVPHIQQNERKGFEHNGEK